MMMRLALAFAALALAAGEAAAARWTAFEKLPGATPVQVLVREKPRAYFRLTPQAPLTVTVEGPAQVRLTTRVELPPGSARIAAYAVRALEGGRLLEELATESSAAAEVRLQGGSAALGKSRKMTFDVPAGNHRLTLTLGGAAAALVRVQRSAPRGGEPPMVTLTPVAAARSVLVAEGEKTIPYYSVMPGQPVRVRVVGPTTLEVLARLDYDATMRGTQSYRLRFSERKQVLSEVEFRTTKATTATYTNLKDRVPSKFDRATLPVGEGTHEITIELVQPVRGSAEIHARIPEPSVGNEE
ncbi:MAG: hypothetical protein HZC42_13945 [Candidatus Eisenbacteria bacterium]|nr:hypothetical protein [Candidatus Eisenbacteria bacterium]